MTTKTLREFARGKDCQVGLFGCTPFHEGVCLAHWRDSSTGMGQKEHDLIAAWACPSCHDQIDGRANYKPEWDVDGYHAYLKEVERYFMKGIIKTQQKVLRALNQGEVRLPK